MMPGAKKPGLTRQPQGGAKKKLTLTSVNGKKVNAPKGTKTVTSSGGKLVYKDKYGKPIKKRG